MITDAISFSESCELCQKLRPNQCCEPLMYNGLPSGHLEKLGADLFVLKAKSQWLLLTVL